MFCLKLYRFYVKFITLTSVVLLLPMPQFLLVGKSCGRKSPKCARFIRTRANEGEVRGMPAAGDDLVVVRGDADGGQRLAEVSLQVRQDQPVVVAPTQ